MRFSFVWCYALHESPQAGGGGKWAVCVPAKAFGDDCCSFHGERILSHAISGPQQVGNPPFFFWPLSDLLQVVKAVDLGSQRALLLREDHGLVGFSPPPPPCERPPVACKIFFTKKVVHCSSVQTGQIPTGFSSVHWKPFEGQKGRASSSAKVLVVAGNGPATHLCEARVFVTWMHSSMAWSVEPMAQTPPVLGCKVSSLTVGLRDCGAASCGAVGLRAAGLLCSRAAHLLTADTCVVRDRHNSHQQIWQSSI